MLAMSHSRTHDAENIDILAKEGDARLYRSVAASVQDPSLGSRPSKRVE